MYLYIYANNVEFLKYVFIYQKEICKTLCYRCRAFMFKVLVDVKLLISCVLIFFVFSVIIVSIKLCFIVFMLPFV